MSFAQTSSTKLDHTDSHARDVSQWNVVVNDGTQDYEIEVFVNHDNDNYVEFEQPEDLEDFEQDELFLLIAEATAGGAA